MIHNPRIVDIKTLDDARREIEKIGCDPKSIEIMAPKAVYRAIKLKDIILQDAVIIKQDMLSIGGEVAIPKEAFEKYDKTGDILVFGTLKQLKELVGKLKRHYNRLKTVADEIENILEDVK